MMNILRKELYLSRNPVVHKHLNIVRVINFALRTISKGILSVEYLLL